MMMAVSFERYGRLYYLDPGAHSPAIGDKVLVPTDSGPEVAECVWAPQWVSEEIDGLPVCAGLASDGDLVRDEENRKRRAEGRLRPYGIRRGTRGRRGPRAASGWEALTPTEIKIAALVARGDSTSDIAKGMFLSRRTVQTYISHILSKLGAKGRVEIVREALRHGVSP